MLLIKCEENGSMGKKLVNFTKKLMNFGNFLVHSSKVYSTNNFAKTNKIVTLSVVCNFPHSVAHSAAGRQGISRILDDVTRMAFRRALKCAPT